MKRPLIFLPLVCALLTGCVTSEADYLARGFSPAAAHTAAREDQRQQAAVAAEAWRLASKLEAAEGNTRGAAVCESLSNIADQYTQ